ncbi:MAG: hypothetical protein NTU62_11670 [Spirochaetes bacterium]|nr:hypothetical protein [Spirochaetota bacterium]
MRYVVKKRKPGAVKHLSPEAWLRRYAKYWVKDYETRIVPKMARQVAHNRLANHVNDYLISADWFVIRTHDEYHTPIEAGVCDMIALRGGHALLLEFKVVHDKLKPKQIQFRDCARRHGYEVVEVRSLEDVIGAIHAPGVAGNAARGDAT